MSRFKDAYKPPASAKSVCHDLDIQCDIGTDSLESRDVDTDQTLDTRQPGHFLDTHQPVVLYQPQEQVNCLPPPRTLILDFTMTHIVVQTQLLLYQDHSTLQTAFMMTSVVYPFHMFTVKNLI